MLRFHLLLYQKKIIFILLEMMQMQHNKMKVKQYLFKILHYQFNISRILQKMRNSN